MAKNQITINILETEARVNGYFNLKEINNAILEPNGKISFEAKEKDKPATKKDMQIKSKNNPIVYNIIIDGEIIEENLKHINKDKKWLYHELKVLGRKKEDILLLTLDSNEKIDIYFIVIFTFEIMTFFPFAIFFKATLLICLNCSFIKVIYF